MNTMPNVDVPLAALKSTGPFLIGDTSFLTSHASLDIRLRSIFPHDIVMAKWMGFAGR